MRNDPEVTALLDRAREGDSDAFGTLVERIYGELRAIAHGQRRRLGASDTINTTAVVHEAYAKMASQAQRQSSKPFADRGHFFRVASHVMRDIIVDYAKAQSAAKRGGKERAISLDALEPQARVESIDPLEVLSVHDALTKLESLDAEAARVAELRYFAGLTTEQTAEALDLSPATVKRRWTVARAWLYQQLKDGQ